MPNSEASDGDQTPVGFHDDEHIALPDDDKPLIKAKSNPLDIRGPSPLAQGGYVAPSNQPTTTPSQTKAVSDVGHLRTFRLFKSAEGFGFSVQAGVDRTGVSVKAIKSGGIADKAGMVIGDELIEVDGKNLTILTRDEVISYMQNIPKLTVGLEHFCSTHSHIPDRAVYRVAPNTARHTSTSYVSIIPHYPLTYIHHSCCPPCASPTGHYHSTSQHRCGANCKLDAAAVR